MSKTRTDRIARLKAALKLDWYFTEVKIPGILDLTLDEFKALEAETVNERVEAKLVELAETVCAVKLKPEPLLKRAESILGSPLLKKTLSEEDLSTGLKLSVEGHAEASGHIWQGEVGAILAEYYRDGEGGHLGIAPDHAKANELARTPVEATYATKTVYDNAGAVNALRLWLVRAHRTLNLFNLGFMNHLGMAPKIASLIYFVEFSVDLSMMARAVLCASDTERRHTPSALKRLSNAYHKGSRPTRLWNTRWGFINMLDFLPIASYVSPIANSIGFASDLIEDIGKYFYQRRQYNKKLALNARIIDALKLKQQADPNDDKLIESLAQWELVQTKTVEEKKVELNDRLRRIAVSAVIFVGTVTYLMLSVILPVLVPALAPVMLSSAQYFDIRMIASLVAFSGSWFGGFGWRTGQYIKKKLPEKPTFTEFDDKAAECAIKDFDDNAEKLAMDAKQSIEEPLSDQPAPTETETLSSQTLPPLLLVPEDKTEKSNEANKNEANNFAKVNPEEDGKDNTHTYIRVRKMLEGRRPSDPHVQIDASAIEQEKITTAIEGFKLTRETLNKPLSELLTRNLSARFFSRPSLSRSQHTAPARMQTDGNNTPPLTPPHTPPLSPQRQASDSVAIQSNKVDAHDTPPASPTTGGIRVLDREGTPSPRK